MVNDIRYIGHRPMQPWPARRASSREQGRSSSPGELHRGARAPHGCLLGCRLVSRAGVSWRTALGVRRGAGLRATGARVGCVGDWACSMIHRRNALDFWFAPRACGGDEAAALGGVGLLLEHGNQHPLRELVRKSAPGARWRPRAPARQRRPDSDAQCRRTYPRCQATRDRNNRGNHCVGRAREADTLRRSHALVLLGRREQRSTQPRLPAQCRWHDERAQRRSGLATTTEARQTWLGAAHNHHR